MKTPSEQDLKSLSFNLTNLEYQLQATLSVVRAIMGKQDAPQPINAAQAPAFDMETQVKASGQWECNDLRCRNCSNDQNKECLETYQIRVPLSVTSLHAPDPAAPAPKTTPLVVVPDLSRMTDEEVGAWISAAASDQERAARKVTAYARLNSAKPEPAKAPEPVVASSAKSYKAAKSSKTPVPKPSSKTPAKPTTSARVVQPKPYDLYTTYSRGDVIAHPKWGDGSVIKIDASTPSKPTMDVRFKDGVRQLAHGRQPKAK